MRKSGYIVPVAALTLATLFGECSAMKTAPKGSSATSGAVVIKSKAHTMRAGTYKGMELPGTSLKFAPYKAPGEKCKEQAIEGSCLNGQKNQKPLTGGTSST